MALKTSNKTNKSFTKRIKMTRRGKLIARHPGQNHFNAKESSAKQMHTNRTQELSYSKKVSQRYITTASKAKF